MRLMRVLGLFLLCAGAVNAQTNKGGIKGSVLDANGAAVPGATVTITNLGTNQSTKVTTSENGAYSLDFFHVQVPQGFATRTAKSFDITTLPGLKLYRLRQTYDANFGTLFAVANPRYIQFGVKINF